MRFAKRALALLLCFSIALSFSMAAFADVQSDRRDEAELAMGKALKVLKKEPADYDSAMVAFALTRGGKNALFSGANVNFEGKVDTALMSNGGVLGEEGSMETHLYPSVILAITACGKYANHIRRDLFVVPSFFKYLDPAGNETLFNFLIALDCGGIGEEVEGPVPTKGYLDYEKGDVTRAALVERIMAQRCAQGGFTYDNVADGPRAGATAVALQALKRYRDNADVAAAIDEALTYLESAQREDGSFGQAYDTALVVIALTELGIDPYEFGNGKALDYILAAQLENGYFEIELGSGKSADATAYGALALNAYIRLVDGQNSLYDLTDVLGATHNTFAPQTQWIINLSFGLAGFLLLAIIVIYIRSQFIIRKWRKNDELDESGAWRKSEAAVAEYTAHKLRTQQRLEEKEKATAETRAAVQAQKELAAKMKQQRDEQKQDKKNK